MFLTRKKEDVCRLIPKNGGGIKKQQKWVINTWQLYDLVSNKE